MTRQKPRPDVKFWWECPYCLREFGDPSERTVDRWTIRHLVAHVNQLAAILDKHAEDGR